MSEHSFWKRGDLIRHRANPVAGQGLTGKRWLHVVGQENWKEVPIGAVGILVECWPGTRTQEGRILINGVLCTDMMSMWEHCT